MKIHIVQHVNPGCPSAIEIWAKRKGHTLSYTRLMQGDKLPTDCSDFDFLIVMGGPQCPDTTIEECPYFDAVQEIALIKQAIANDKFILGVCLGAQLVGEALGAPYEHSPNKEFGVYEVTLTDAAKDDPIFSTFPRHFLVSHLHSDMPGLTADATILASSEGCPRQIIRYAAKIYGFQCHFEFTAEKIERLITSNREELEAGKNLPYVQDADEFKQHDFTVMNRLLYNFLDKIELDYEPKFGS